MSERMSCMHVLYFCMYCAFFSFWISLQRLASPWKLFIASFCQIMNKRHGACRPFLLTFLLFFDLKTTRQTNVVQLQAII